MNHQYRNYFDEIFISEEDMEGLKEKLDSDLRVRMLTRRILSAKDQLSTRLDKGGISIWLALEEMLNLREAASKMVYFNLGFQYGHRAGEAAALRMLKEGHSTYAAFSDRIRDLVVKNGLSEAVSIAALVENAWALALDVLAEHPTRIS